MTVNILAEEVEIIIEDGYWRLYERTEKLLPSLLFEAIKGRGFLQYSSTYGQKVGLPGTKLSASYIRAVVIGYEPKALRWMLGFHLSKESDDKPRWFKLIRWESAPNQQYASEVQQAGRILAEYLGCPLKVFGVKRLPQQSKKTGPIGKHTRQDVSSKQIRRKLEEVYLPIEHKNVWLGDGRGNKLTLRIAGGSGESAGKIAPAYQLVEFSENKEVVKLVPPTGLLGAFFSGIRGREIPYHDVRNVELRYIIDTISTTKDDEDSDLLMEVSTTHRIWDIYLTLADENLLLVTTSHTMDSELTRQRLEKVSAAGSKRSTSEYTSNINYYRKIAEQNDQLESARKFAESAAYVIASRLNCRLVLTQLGEDIL